MPEQVEENRKEIERLEDEKQDKIDTALIDPSNNVVTAINENRTLIDELSGSIEVKAYLRTILEPSDLVLPINVETTATFTKTLETNSNILAYDEVTDYYFTSEGIVWIDVSILVESVQNPTLLKMRLRDSITHEIILEVDTALDNPVNDLYLTINDLFSLDNDVNFYMTFEANRTITLNDVRVIQEKSVTTEQDLKTENITATNPNNESQDPQATTQYLINENNKNYHDSNDSLIGIMIQDIQNNYDKNVEQDGRLDGHDSDIAQLNNDVANKSDGWREIFSGSVLETTSTSTSSATQITCSENPILGNVQYAVQLLVQTGTTTYNRPIVFFRGNGGFDGQVNGIVACYSGAGFVLSGLSTTWRNTYPSNTLGFFASRGASVTTGSQVPYDIYVEKIWVVNE